ncbi:MAG: hypothetical protein KAR42_16940 [candidate division Zixibacteria bacterium]|nr:hypothetical protein [candidate division Zixibacteria bacterium]
MKQYADRCFMNFTWLWDQLHKENQRQITKWGIQERTAFEWLTYAAEEFGSLAKAISEHHYRKGQKEKVITEAFHAATLILKIAEMYENEEENHE